MMFPYLFSPLKTGDGGGQEPPLVPAAPDQLCGEQPPQRAAHVLLGGARQGGRRARSSPRR